MGSRGPAKLIKDSKVVRLSSETINWVEKYYDASSIAQFYAKKRLAVLGIECEEIPFDLKLLGVINELLNDKPLVTSKSQNAANNQ